MIKNAWKLKKEEDNKYPPIPKELFRQSVLKENATTSSFGLDVTITYPRDGFTKGLREMLKVQPHIKNGYLSPNGSPDEIAW